MNLSLDTFGHDDEIGRLFEEYDRLVRWEEHNSRLDATDPVVERAAARGRIVAFIANTATLQQDAHTSIAEPAPQDADRDWMGEAKETVEFWREYAVVLEGERARWAERENELVEALDALDGGHLIEQTPMWAAAEPYARRMHGQFAAKSVWRHAADDFVAGAEWALRRARAALGQEGTTNDD